MKKYSKNFDRDYDFYLRNVDIFTFSGKAPPIVLLNRDGKSAKECFHIFDSTGVLHACREQILLKDLLVTKASVNLHISLWAQGVVQGVLCPPELEEMMGEYGAPDWVAKAVLRQAEPRLIEQSKRIERGPHLGLNRV